MLADRLAKVTIDIAQNNTSTPHSMAKKSPILRKDKRLLIIFQDVQQGKSNSHLDVVTFQCKVNISLRCVLDAPWYVRNRVIIMDLEQIPTSEVMKT